MCVYVCGAAKLESAKSQVKTRDVKKEKTGIQDAGVCVGVDKGAFKLATPAFLTGITLVSNREIETRAGEVR